MTIYSLVQVAFTFLLAFFSIIPEFKANNAKGGEKRKLVHRIVLVLKKPLFRIICLIILVVSLFFITRKIETINTKKSADDADSRETKRSKQAYQLQKAITDKLSVMGYQYDSIHKVLVRIKDSINVAKKVYVGEKPLLTVIFRVDSIGIGTENINIEMRAAGANISDIYIFTSIAAIVNSKPILVYKNQPAFANHISLGKDIEQTNISLSVRSTESITDYLIYQHGYYKDIDKNKYTVDKIYFAHKRPWTSTDIQQKYFNQAKTFFKTGEKFDFKY